MTFETSLLVIGALLVLSVLASKASGVLGIPSLLVFIAVGMIAGSEGLGGLYFDDAKTAQNLGVIALAFILMAGGMDTRWNTVKPVLKQSMTLSTVGVFVTAVVVGFCVHTFAHFTILEGLLLGSIVAATDAAAVFSLLRGRGINLRDDVQGILELESGTNDPMSVFLTIGITSLMTEKISGPAVLVQQFFIEMTLGVAVGILVGKVGKITMNRLKLEFEALYSVLSVAMVLIAFSLADVIHGNGFLAVFITGLVYGHEKSHRKKGLMKFHDGLAWLMQIAMFLSLGLLVFPSRLLDIMPQGILIAFILMFIARPIGVLISLVPYKTEWKVQGLIGWAGLRGAVPIVLATYPMLAGVKRSGEIFNIVFFVVLFSALVQGTTLPWLAKRLQLEGN